MRFIWDCVCETVARSNKGKGGGCILAHCMGLGKTLSVSTCQSSTIYYNTGTRRVVPVLTGN